MRNKYITTNILRLFGIFLFVLGIIGSSACTAEDSNTSIIQQEVSFTIDQEAVTRATQSGTFEKGDAIGIFAFVRTNSADKAALTGEYANNKKWIWNGSTFLPENEDDKIYYTGSSKLDFYAYYPYDEQNYNPKDLNFSIAQNQSDQSGYQASDFLTAISNSGYNNEIVPLDFNHRLSTVQLKVKGVKSITGAFINNVFPTVNYSFENNSLSPTGTKQTASMLLTEKNGNYSTYVGCVPTQTIAVGTHFFTVKHAEGEDIRIQADSAPLEEGKITAYDIGLTKTITINQTAGGTATGAGEYTHGDNAILVATPLEGSQFIGWYETGVSVSTSQTYTFEVTKDRTLESRFSKTKHTLTVINGTGSGIYDHGANVTIVANNLIDKSFDRWSDGNTNQSRTVTVTADATYTALYTDNVVTYSYSISASPTQLNFSYGAGTQRIIVHSVKQKYVNGIATGAVESVPYTGRVIGAGFSLSGANVSASANPTYNPRTGSVTFTINGRSENTTVNLSQAAKEDSTPTYSNYRISANVNSLSFSFNGETKLINVVATCERTLNGVTTTENVSYRGQAAGTGFSVNGVRVSASANPYNIERAGSVTFTIQGRSENATIRLSQAAKPSETTYTYNLSVNPSFIDFISNGETKSFTVTSTRQKYVNGSPSGAPENVAYSTSTNGAGFSSTNSRVTAAENTSKTEKKGTVTITQSGSGKKATISLLQYGKLIIET
jgi:hypothetical protein